MARNHKTFLLRNLARLSAYTGIEGQELIRLKRRAMLQEQLRGLSAFWGLEGSALDEKIDGLIEDVCCELKKKDGYHEMTISGPIYGENGLDSLLKDLNDLKASRLVVRLSSPGGSAALGLAFYERLREHARSGMKVETIGQGLVASAASTIYLAGDQRQVGPAGIVMIHPPWSDCCESGSRSEIQSGVDKTLQALGAFERSLSAIYKARVPDSDLSEYVDEKDGWFVGEEAVEIGLSTDLDEDLVEEEKDDPEESVQDAVRAALEISRSLVTY